MIIKRMEFYHQIWKYFDLKYTINQIGETIELIEKTKIYPGMDEESYEIWQKYLELKSQSDE